MKKQILETEKWRQFRDQIWERDQGKCRLCGGEGHDLHLDTMKMGPFDPCFAKVVCRPCHEVWLGYPPEHLPDDNPFKDQLVELAERVRLLPKKFRAWYW
ncbi:hypothetical protein N9D23_00585 [Rubripirellula sp.]|nr:hypothetical protein [Rubripirellula sp.]